MSVEQINEEVIKEPKKLLRKAYDGTITAMSYAEILLNRAIKDLVRNKPLVIQIPPSTFRSSCALAVKK